MAPQDDFYIAWDGREYAGLPPEGWFLAADNRWWPPRELIDGDDAVDQAAVDQPADAYRPDADDVGSPSAPATPLPAPPTNPTAGPANNDPPADWAPTPTGGSPEEPQPPQQWTPPGGGQRQRKRGKQSKFRLGPVLLFFFILSRCDAFDEVQDSFSTPEVEIGFVEATVDDFVGTNECSRTFLSGSISNAADFPQTFIVTTDRQDGGPNYQSDELPLDAGETRSWVINLLDEDRSGGFCPPVIVWIGP